MLVLHGAPPWRTRHPFNHPVHLAVRPMPSAQCSLSSRLSSRKARAQQVRVPKQSFISFTVQDVRSICGELNPHNHCDLIDALARLELVLNAEQTEVGNQASSAFSTVALPVQAPITTTAADAIAQIRQQRAAADRRCIAFLLQLLVNARYVPLSPRDVALSASLNADSLNQPNTRALDDAFSGLALPEASLPPQLASVAVFTRGYDSVTQQGLLLVEKLDYLQLRAVAAAVRALQDGASLAARRARCQTWLGRKKLARALRRTLKQSTQRLVPQANQAPAPADVETTKRDLVAQPGGGVPAQRPTSPSSTTPEDAPLGMPPALGQLVELQERLLQRAEVTELQAQLQARIKQGAAEIDQKLEIDQKQISEELVRAGRTLKTALDEYGLSPKPGLAGGGLAVLLSSYGLLPMTAVSLADFDKTWPLKPSASTPLPQVSIGQALRGADGRLDVQRLVQPALLADPTFTGVAVLYRRRPPPTVPARIQQRVDVLRLQMLDAWDRFGSLVIARGDARGNGSTGAHGGDGHNATQGVSDRARLAAAVALQYSGQYEVVSCNSDQSGARDTSTRSKLLHSTEHVGDPKEHGYPEEQDTNQKGVECRLLVREAGVTAPVLELYQQLPMGSWKVVFPDKLLQFRPLEGLRADLITLLGLAALAAQLQFDSAILELISLASASVFLTRVVLGYKRMSDRYSNIVSTLLRSNMLASQRSALLALASAAGRQQFREAALVYAVLLANEGMTARSIKSTVERLCEQKGVQVDFAVTEALAVLQRLQLAQAVQGVGVTTRWVAAPPVQASKVLTQRWNELLDEGAGARVVVEDDGNGAGKPQNELTWHD